jgi:hypothetical protein
MGEVQLFSSEDHFPAAIATSDLSAVLTSALLIVYLYTLPVGRRPKRMHILQVLFYLSPGIICAGFSTSNVFFLQNPPDRANCRLPKPNGKKGPRYINAGRDTFQQNTNRRSL